VSVTGHDLIPTNDSFSIELKCIDESAISTELDALMSDTTLNTNLTPGNFVDDSNNLITPTNSYPQTTNHQYEITDISVVGNYEYSTEGDEVTITIPTAAGRRDSVIVSGQYTVASFPLIYYSTVNYDPISEDNFPMRDDEGSVPIILPDSEKWPPYNDPDAPRMTYFSIDTRHDKTISYTCTYTLYNHYTNESSFITIPYAVGIHNNTGEALSLDLKNYFSSLQGN
jgi:hypothetical protein